MTHTRQYADHEGTFGHWTMRADTPCPRCRAATHVWVRVWESDDGAYEDYQYRCEACTHVWWIDGIDS